MRFHDVTERDRIFFLINFSHFRLSEKFSAIEVQVRRNFLIWNYYIGTGLFTSLYKLNVKKIENEK